MKAYNKWNYRPYFPYSHRAEEQNPYICRLAPSEFGFELEWFDKSFDGGHTLFYAKRASGEFKSIELSSKKASVSGLESYTDYEFYIEAESGRKSRTRLVRTGKVPGVVINYLHPDDEYYAHSGKYLCSPSIVRTPKGNLIASMDLFKGGSAQNVSVLFKSTDDGKTWEYLTDLMPCFWGSLFVHQGKLWMIAVSCEYGDVLIGSSEDEGETWSEPAVLLRGATVGGTSIYGGPHKAPMPVVESNGRLWTAVEYGGWHVKDGFANLVVSADAKSDISKPENWNITEAVNISPEEGAKPSSIEGNVVETPEGELINFLRYAPEKATVFKINKASPDSALEYEGIRRFPMAHTKFEIRKHTDGFYYSVGNTFPARTRCAVYKSSNLKDWEFMTDVADYRHLDTLEVGFQYPAFIFDGNDMLVLVRTAFNLASNFHDANYMLFFRIGIE